MGDDSVILLSGCFVFIIFVIVLLVLLLKKKSPSPSTSTSASSSTAMIPWLHSPGSPGMSAPEFINSQTELSDGDKALAVISSLAEYTGYYMGVKFTAIIVSEIADAICAKLFSNVTFVERLQSFSIRYPKLASLLSLRFAELAPDLRGAIQSLIKFGKAPGAALSASYTSLEESLARLVSSTTRLPVDSAAIQAAERALTEASAESARVARAGAGAAMGLAGSALGVVDNALIALTIINMALSAANVGGYTKGNNAGDFLEVKYVNDSASDKAWFDFQKSYPAYSGPLDETFKVINKAGSTSASTSLTSAENNILRDFNIQLELKVRAYIQSSLGHYLDNLQNRNSALYVSPTLTYVFDALFAGDLAETTSKCILRPTTVPDITIPPVSINDFYTDTPPIVRDNPTDLITTSVPAPYVPPTNNNLNLDRITAEKLSKVHNNINAIIDNLEICDYMEFNMIALNQMCLDAGGVVAEGQFCSYKKSECLTKQEWPLNTENGTKDSTYTEWRSIGTERTPEMDPTGNIDRNLDWYGANYPWKYDKVLGDGSSETIYSTGTKQDGVFYRDMTQPREFSLSGGFGEQPNIPSGFCLVRQFTTRTNCEEIVTTGTGSGQNIYDPYTGLCQNTEKVCSSRGIDYSLESISNLGGDKGVKFPNGFSQKLYTCSKGIGQKVGEAILGGVTVSSYFNSLVLLGSMSPSKTKVPYNIPAIPSAGQRIYLTGSAATILALRRAANTLTTSAVAITDTNLYITTPSGNTDPENFTGQLINIAMSGLSGTQQLIG